jgi:hypothetical protein
MNDQQIPHETAAFIIGCTRQTVYNLTKSGKLAEPLTAASVQTYIETTSRTRRGKASAGDGAGGDMTTHPRNGMLIRQSTNDWLIAVVESAPAGKNTARPICPMTSTASETHGDQRPPHCRRPDLLEAAQGAIAALSQPHTYPADIEAAAGGGKTWLARGGGKSNGGQLMRSRHLASDERPHEPGDAEWLKEMK